jgi:PPM family protein phosphatase
LLRIAEHFHDSDLGRQRQGNEDNYYVRAPLFVVADGMGGAQAGEVASELAVRRFEAGLPQARTPADSLVGAIKDANAQIHEEARIDPDRAGMGTTVTAAYLDDDTVVIAHVGDSRAYLLRDGDLVRLTRDHSLVGELVARGKLTEEQAESHPQRSVITRALGANPDVEVDIERLQARAGDMFLLCSDGLTGMVPEPGLKQMLEAERPLSEIGRALIAAANEAGGRDNITVILFRLEDVEDRRSPAVADTSADTAEYEAFPAASAPVAVQARAPAETEPETAEEEPAAPARETPERTGRLQPIEDAPPPPAAGQDRRKRRGRRRRRRRSGGLVLLFLAVILPLIVGGWLATRAVYFVGTDPADGRTVAIFRGLPYDLPFGAHLYERYYRSGVTLADVPEARRARFTDHQLRSRDDAEDLVIALEKDQIE